MDTKISEIQGHIDKPKYWIFTTTYYCPACGREDNYKERIYDHPKPTKWEERNTIIEQWDYCDI